MGAQGETQVNATELEKVRPSLPMLFDRDDTFFSQIEKKDVEVVSKRDMRIPLRLRPGGYFGHFNPAGGDLGRGAGPTFEKALVPTVNLRYAMEWTTEAEWATDDRRKAVVNVLKDNVAQAMPQFRSHVDSLCMGDGTGVLGVVSAVANAAGVDTVTLATDGFGAKLLQYGQKVTYYLADLSAPVSAVNGRNTEISYRSIEDKQIKTPTTTGLAAGHLVVVEGLLTANPVSIYGVKYHHSNSATGNWLGLSRASFPEIRSNRVNAAGAGFSLQFPRLAIGKIGDRLGMKNRSVPLTAWMHPAQAHAYEKLAQAVTVINKGTGNEGMNLYFSDTNMQLAGAPVRLHYSWDKTRIDFINLKNWGRAEMHAPDFYKIGGKYFFEVRSQDGGVAAATLIYLAASFQVFCENPAEDAYIDNLAIPAGW